MIITTGGTITPVTVQGTATLGGELIIELTTQPSSGDFIELIDAAQFTGMVEYEIKSEINICDQVISLQFKWKEQVVIAIDMT